MKKTLFFILAFMVLSYSMHALFNFTQPKKLPPSLIREDISQDHKIYHIAILTPVSHPSLEQIQQGFMETLQAGHPEYYTFKVYNAQGNKALMRSEIEDIASKNYDLIFTVGIQATKMSKEVLTKKQQSIPIVFATVPQVVQHTLDLNPNDLIQMTGTSEVTDFEHQIELISYLKKDIKTILLVYDPTLAGLEQDKQRIHSFLEQKGIKLIPIEVFKTNEIRQKILPFIEQTDLVLVLKDNTVIPGLDTLSKLCESHHILLYASDLDSVDRGAGLGFGVHEYQYGVEAAKKTFQILHHQISPQAIPITPVDDFKLKINPIHLKKQGLELDPHLLFLIQQGEGI